MTGMEYLAPVIARSDRPDAVTDENGVKICPVCGEPTRETTGGFEHGRMCACLRREEARRQRCQKELERLAKADKARSWFRDSGLYLDGLQGCTFARDLRPDSAASRTARAYAENWEEMKKNNYGLLFFGSVGTGKSFYAAAILNALQEKGVYALMASAPQLIAFTENGRRTRELLELIRRADYFVLDDLGAERDTDFALEQLELIADVRSQTGKPLVVTTNLARKDLDDRTDLRRIRIYDRVKQMCCCPVRLTGKSLRADSALARGRACADLLRGHAPG